MNAPHPARKTPFKNSGHQHYSSNGLNLKVCYYYGLDAKDIEILADVLEYIPRSDDGWIAITNIIRRHPGLRLQGAGSAPLAWRTVEDQVQKRFKYYEKIGLLCKTVDHAGVDSKKNRYSVNHDLETLLRTCRELTPEEEAKLPELKGAMAEPYITAKQMRKKGTSRNVSNPDINKDKSLSVFRERTRQIADTGHVWEREEGTSQNGLTHTASRIQRDAKINILLPEALMASGEEISAKGNNVFHNCNGEIEEHCEAGACDGAAPYVYHEDNRTIPFADNLSDYNLRTDPNTSIEPWVGETWNRKQFMLTGLQIEPRYTHPEWLTMDQHLKENVEQIRVDYEDDSGHYAIWLIPKEDVTHACSYGEILGDIVSKNIKLDIYWGRSREDRIKLGRHLYQQQSVVDECVDCI